MTALNIIEAFDDRDLLGGYFDGPSWDTWRAVLKATYALPMSGDEVDLFRSVAGDRDPPAAPVQELWAIVGRRGGKDSIASAIATCTAALYDYSPFLRPGERATVACIARDREQARIILRYIAAYFAERVLLKAMVTRETVDGLELVNRVDIIVVTNDFRALRGRTFVCVILDEVAFYASENTATPDFETYHAVLPGLATLPGSILVGITSPWKRAGLAYDRWAKSYGKNDPRVLVIWAPSKVMNRTLPQHIIDDAMERDPQQAAAEWLAQWRDDLVGFLSRDLIEAAVERGVSVRPPQAHHSYVAFYDPSGGQHDSSAGAIAHREGNAAVLDLLYEKRGPHNPATAIAEWCALLKSYGLRQCRGDRYAVGFVLNAFEEHGITYEHSELNRSEIYLSVLPGFTSGRVLLLDNQRLVSQFAALERRSFSSGRDRVDHPSAGADDASNAAAGALVQCLAEEDSVGLWAKLASPDDAFNLPRWCY